MFLRGVVGSDQNLARAAADRQWAQIGFRIGNKSRNGVGRNRWVDHHDIRGAANARDRRNIADEIEIEERRVDRVRNRYPKERITVGKRSNDRFSADVRGSARPVLDDEWLGEPLLESLTHQAR